MEEKSIRGFSVNKKNSHLPNSFDIKSGLKYRNWNSKNLTTYLLFPNGKQPIELEITILFFWFDYTYETKVILCVVFFDRQCLKWKIFEFIFDFAKKNCFSWSSGCTIQVCYSESLLKMCWWRSILPNNYTYVVDVVGCCLMQVCILVHLQPINSEFFPIQLLEMQEHSNSTNFLKL